MTIDDSTAMIQSLRMPAAYPHPVAEIKLLETHISWVFLTGEFAYKLKKPVNLGFVDFSTLELRRFFCDEELRLNRRLASDLYLGVLPITGSPEAPRIGGSGRPFEYCVQMRQFDQACLMSQVIVTGRLEPRHVDALAGQVFEFHDRVPVAEPASRFGAPEAVAEPIRANFAHLDFPANPSERSLVERLENWCERELQERHDALAGRKRDGFIRECHGDMHLGNMILAGDAITVFDCIEFNEDLRWIDVLSDVAFCVMDLEDRGRPDLARRFLNSYLELSGDYVGLAVFRMYLVYRAIVRAKVTRLRQTQSRFGLEANEQEQEQLKREVRNYLELADRCSHERLSFLAVTHGLSGSGKTSGSQALVEKSGAIRVRSDIERKRLAGVGRFAKTRATVDGGIYAKDFSVRTYERLADLAIAVVHAGFPAIVDATFLSRSDRIRFRKIAETLGVPFVILDFPTPEPICRERIQRRAASGNDASEATEAVFDQQLQLDEPIDEEERMHARWVDASRPDWIEQLLSKINGEPTRAG